MTESSVRAWTAPLVLPTYPALNPDPNPMFFDTRDVQRARGNIYPAPFTDRLSAAAEERTYQAVYLENEYLEVILLPELGGRIFAARDKLSGYDFFYRHKVIKPALIGLLGPWISGGVEFNWPQHHRPTTFAPLDHAVEHAPDGSVTVWMGEHEPLNRTKGMVGVCLYPGRAVIETRVRLYNRTPFAQTFLWWANAGVKINDRYQVIFPPDVHYTQFHTKEFVTSYPLSQGPYPGIVEGREVDLSYWVNSPGATSFFAAPSRYDFFGGYDHEAGAGVVYVANRHISPGKKFFTWGNGPFGHAWQRNLMDDTGEYLELMAGVYTDNQPDFSWIAPRETRTFRQFWYPVARTGGMKNANPRAALNLEIEDGAARVAVYATEVLPGARMILRGPAGTILDETADLAPGQPFLSRVALPPATLAPALLLRVLDSAGAEIIRYAPEPAWDGALPEPYQPPAEPAALDSQEDLFLTGLHLEQYRHPFRDPAPYWLEALARDPGDSRARTALGRLALRQGRFDEAAEHLQAAVRRLTLRNPNPASGEAHYHLGLARKFLGDLDGAYEALYKAAWNYDYQSAAYFVLAQIDCLRQDWPAALAHLRQAAQTNVDGLQIRHLRAAVLLRMGRAQEAARVVQNNITLDALDPGAWLALAQVTGRPTEPPGGMQAALDCAFDLAAAGLWPEAEAALAPYAAETMPAYTLGWLAQQQGDPAAPEHFLRAANALRAGAAAPASAANALRAGAAAPASAANALRPGTAAPASAANATSAGATAPASAANALSAEAPVSMPVFPSRLEEMLVLEAALGANPVDTQAHLLLGFLLYDKQQHQRAVEHWQAAVRLDPSCAGAWRGLGLAAYNLRGDIDGALNFLRAAWQANPSDPRLLLEYDGLRRRAAHDPAARLETLLSAPGLLAQRDDLATTAAGLLNRLGRPREALALLQGRTFHPWEGGEGGPTEQYALAHVILGRAALEAGDPAAAAGHLRAGLDFPAALGEAASPWQTGPLRYYLALAARAAGDESAARDLLEDLHGHPFYHALAQQALGQEALGQGDEAAARAAQTLAQIEQALADGPQPGYFFQSMPNPTFEDDRATLHRQELLFRKAQALLLLGRGDEARAAFAEVLALDPAHVEAWEEYRRL